MEKTFISGVAQDKKIARVALGRAGGCAGHGL